MKTTTNRPQKNDFGPIVETIGFLKSRRGLSTNEAAAHIGMDPERFRDMFVRWAGTVPERYIRYIGTEYTASVLRPGKADRTGDTEKPDRPAGTAFGGISVRIEAMTDEELRDGGRRLSVRYSFSESPFGEVLAASTDRGVCYMAFADDRDRTFDELRTLFPAASYTLAEDGLQRNALAAFAPERDAPVPIELHLKGTPFQMEVWKALLRIPEGELTTYGELARRIGRPGAARAVGSAVGANPVSYLIPCHRVVRSSGEPGGYHWGTDRKTAMIGWEAVRRENRR